jgi:hypothetical protein
MKTIGKWTVTDGADGIRRAYAPSTTAGEHHGLILSRDRKEVISIRLTCDNDETFALLQHGEHLTDAQLRGVIVTGQEFPAMPTALIEALIK